MKVLIIFLVAEKHNHHSVIASKQQISFSKYVLYKVFGRKDKVVENLDKKLILLLSIENLSFSPSDDCDADIKIINFINRPIGA